MVNPRDIGGNVEGNEEEEEKEDEEEKKFVYSARNLPLLPLIYTISFAGSIRILKLTCLNTISKFN